MVDRIARDKTVQLLKALLADGITNYRLEDEWPDQSSDFAVMAVGEQLWFYYDDFPEKILTRASLGGDAIKMIERSLVFLMSNLDYQWPAYSFATENRSLIERLLELGNDRSTQQWERFKTAGEIHAWPFLRLVDYQNATKSCEP
jgi:hypothetical protein